MKKIKQYKYIIVIALVVLGFIFYWFELRPIQIRNTCFNKHLSPRKLDLSFKEFLKEKDNPLPPFGEDAYKNCLRESGLIN
ncbi:MAG: hypothetical protein WCW47_00740 [Candidatus Paceibacterota bacterium]|jgi:hypothetical protein